jgi:hypothetical protein
MFLFSTTPQNESDENKKKPEKTQGVPERQPTRQTGILSSCDRKMWDTWSVETKDKIGRDRLNKLGEELFHGLWLDESCFMIFILLIFTRKLPVWEYELMDCKFHNAAFQTVTFQKLRSK